jgi:hypothetical protein
MKVKKRKEEGIEVQNNPANNLEWRRAELKYLILQLSLDSKLLSFPFRNDSLTDSVETDLINRGYQVLR